MSELKGIYVEGTKETPKVEFNNLTGELVLKGRSLPENAIRFYEPLAEWVSKYIKAPQTNTNLHLNLEYFNSASLLWIAKIIKVLSKINIEGSTLYINLYFDNGDSDLEDMEDFKDIISSLFENNEESKITICIRINGTDKEGKVVDQSTIMI
jgi:hypothetical protein